MATKLGDHLDEFVVVGGLVPSLLIPEETVPEGENKDAYDLYYVIRNYGSGVDDVLKHLDPILYDQETQKALQLLRRDFSEPDGVGPRRVAEFLYAAPSEELQADVAGFIRELLRKCDIV